MTIIAYRDGILASDSCWTDNDTHVITASKVKRLSSGALFGGSGDNDVREIELLLDKITNPKKLPTRRELLEFHIEFGGLLVLPRDGVWQINIEPPDKHGLVVGDVGVWKLATLSGFAACGSGRDFALAAFKAHRSITAAKAARIACEFDTACRPPIHTVSLFPLKKTRRR